MLLVLVVLGAVTLLEPIVYLLPASRLRHFSAEFAFAVVAGSTCWAIVTWPGLLTLALGALTPYRLINLLRVIHARSNPQRARRASLRTWYWLFGWQLLLVAGWWLHVILVLSFGQLLVALAWLQVAVAMMLLGSTVRHLRTTRSPSFSASDVLDGKLPTLTVAIPARNETDDLEACLASLVTSNYPKLEILVLDDCSQNKRTPEIIRSFAHDGVRFLQGEVPRPNWLAKNQAYEQLYQAANGELILFCGVDVRLQADSLRLLVGALDVKRKSMISIMPRNVLPPLTAFRATTLVQTMRYAWELALPRRLFARPPVLSTCWLIRRDVIARSGGFAAVSNSIAPESYFAKQSLSHDGYSFMQSSSVMNITSTKSLHEQHTTAVRVQYPRLHRRLELVALLSAAQLGGLVMPYLFLLWVLAGLVSSALSLPGLLAIVLLTIMYTCIMTLTYRRWLLRSLFVLPVAALLDIVLLHESMIRYEFFEVIWKERNVCIPIMRPLETLPKLGAPSRAGL